MVEKFEIKESGSLGKGIFATSLIKHGEGVLQYTGPIISLEEALQKPNGKEGDTIQIGLLEYIDPEEPGLYTNHSCSPNAGIRDDRFLVALWDIQPGEEICFDYSTAIYNDVWTMECLCQSPNCRRIIGDFRDLPRKLQNKYLELNIVQSFIKQALLANIAQQRKSGSGSPPPISR